MFRLVFVLSLIGCGKKWVAEKNTVDTKIETQKAETVQDDFYHYLMSKGVSRSLCVEGLLQRLQTWDCDRVETKRFDANDPGAKHWNDERIEVTCLVKKDENRETFWERHKFVVKNPVLTKDGLTKINMQTHSAICIDTIHSVYHIQFEDPKTKRIKLK